MKLDTLERAAVQRLMSMFDERSQKIVNVTLFSLTMFDSVKGELAEKFRQSMREMEKAIAEAISDRPIPAVVALLATCLAEALVEAENYWYEEVEDEDGNKQTRLAPVEHIAGDVREAVLAGLKRDFGDPL